MPDSFYDINGMYPHNAVRVAMNIEYTDGTKSEIVMLDRRPTPRMKEVPRIKYEDVDDDEPRWEPPCANRPISATDTVK